jgi:hypothetical protein
MDVLECDCRQISISLASLGTKLGKRKIPALFSSAGALKSDKFIALRALILLYQKAPFSVFAEL